MTGRVQAPLGGSLRVACVIGAAAGAIFAAVALYRRHVMQVFTWMSPDVVWLSPLGHMLLAVVLTVGIHVMARALRRGPTWSLLLALLLSFLALSVIPLARVLHPVAIVVLSLGLGIAGATPLAQSGLLRRLQSWPVVACALAIPLAGGLWSIRRDRTRPNNAAANGSPNVLLLILDTVRAASTSLHGYERATTPTIDSLARRGVMYDYAIAPSSWTLPSHAAMFTGHRATDLSASWRRPLDETRPVVAEVLRSKGYATAGFIGNYYYTHEESGLARGFDVYRGYRRSWKELLWHTTVFQTPLVQRMLWTRSAPEAWQILRKFDFKLKSQPHHERRSAEEIVGEFLEWQRSQSGPWFAFLNLYDAHDPYEPPSAYRTMFTANPGEQDKYDGGIRYIDDQIARAVAELERRGALANTLLVITSDHGEQWGEHGLDNHGNALYAQLVHVPLVMHWPKRLNAERVRTPVGLRDLAATILDATGLTDARFPGASLLRRPLSAEPAISETERLDDRSGKPSPALKGNLSALVVDSLHYLRNADTTSQLFDLRNDPSELRDLMNTPFGCATAVALDSVLRQLSPWPATPPLTHSTCARVAAPGPVR